MKNEQLTIKSDELTETEQKLLFLALFFACARMLSKLIDEVSSDEHTKST